MHGPLQGLQLRSAEDDPGVLRQADTAGQLRILTFLLKCRKNPYASKLKKQVTIRMGEDVIEYFKAMAEETGIPYQSLINLYLRDCVAKNRKVNINWLKRA